MVASLQIKDFVYKDFGWDALELIFMLQSHSYDLGSGQINSSIDRQLKDDRIQYCFDICKKLETQQAHLVKKFFRCPTKIDLPDGCLYSRQIFSGEAISKHHHFCCGTTKDQVLNTTNFLPTDSTKLYKIFLKPTAKLIFVQAAIDTIIKKQSKQRLFHNGSLYEPYEIIVLGQDVEKVERIKGK